MSRPRCLLAAVLLLTTVACTAQRSVPGLFGNPPSTVETYVIVSNHHWAAVLIHAVNRGSAYRLGRVETGTTERFVLPRIAVESGDLELRVRPLGHPTDYSTGPILFAPGETIEFTVEHLLELSTVHVH